MREGIRHETSEAIENGRFRRRVKPDGRISKLPIVYINHANIACSGGRQLHPKTTVASSLLCISNERIGTCYVAVKATRHGKPIRVVV